MKKYKLLSMFCLISIAFCLVSCSDDDDIQNFPGGTKARLLPVRISTDDGSSEYLFQYDSSNRLIKQIYNLKEGKDFFYYAEMVIKYDAEGRIEKVTGRASNTTFINTASFTYDDSHIEVTDNYFITNIETDIYNNIVSQQQTPINGEKSNVTKTYYDYDSQYNISAEILTDGISETHAANKYDNRNGIFKSVNIPQWFFATRIVSPFTNGIYNNPVSEVYSKDIDDYKYEQKTSYEYIYNDNAYPVRAAITSPPLYCSTSEDPDDRKTTYRVEYKLAEVVYEPADN